LQDFARPISTFFRGLIPGLLAVFGPRHQFPHGSPAFPVCRFYETITGPGNETGLSCGSQDVHTGLPRNSVIVCINLCRRRTKHSRINMRVRTTVSNAAGCRPFLRKGIGIDRKTLEPAIKLQIKRGHNVALMHGVHRLSPGRRQQRCLRRLCFR